MLKIKDNVDLKELEKYGIQQGYKREQKIIYLVINEERIITPQYSTSAWWNTKYYYGYKRDAIYDLIKDGLVEKVEE